MLLLVHFALFVSIGIPALFPVQKQLNPQSKSTITSVLGTWNSVFGIRYLAKYAFSALQHVVKEHDARTGTQTVNSTWITHFRAFNFGYRQPKFPAVVK